MCTQHPIEEHCKLDPPWDGPQVIPAQLRRVDNLIFRRLNQFSRANGVEQTTPMHGGSLSISTATGTSRCSSGLCHSLFSLFCTKRCFYLAKITKKVHTSNFFM